LPREEPPHAPRIAIPSLLVFWHVSAYLLAQHVLKYWHISADFAAVVGPFGLPRLKMGAGRRETALRGQFFTPQGCLLVRQFTFLRKLSDFSDFDPTPTGFLIDSPIRIESDRMR
jgi:hypothetical protein